MANPSSNFSELRPSDALPEAVKHLSQDRINLYAEAVGDFNPIHVDESFAIQTPFGSTIAHGMLLLAYISDMMALAFGESWFSAGSLSVRFKAPALSRDTITVSGKIDSIKEENDTLSFICSVGCDNQRQETIITGKATVKVTSDGQGD